MAIPQNEFEEAQKVLRKYYNELIKKLAEEIIQNRENFESPGFGNTADDILEKYSQQLNRTSTAFYNLRQFAFREKPEGKTPLGKDEFRCFSCGGVIRKMDDLCKICGWSWK